MKRLVLLFAALLVAGCGEKSSSDSPEPLIHDADVERLLKEAVDFDSLEEREGLVYQPNESEPYSGWEKQMYDSGQVRSLGQVRDGKPHGLWTEWYPNGQKRGEGTIKDAELDGLFTVWDENGQKQVEATFRDGEEVESAADAAKSPPVTAEQISAIEDKVNARIEVERLLKEAVERDSLEERDGRFYQANESEPYSGWEKEMWDSGQLRALAQLKDGKENGLGTLWHENGQKQAEVTWKDGEKVSEKWWNSKGEEVDSREEALK